MEDFYKEICNTTKKEKNILERASIETYVDEAFRFIMMNWQNNVRVAALSGYKQAYIGVYEKNFKLRSALSLYDYFNMTQKGIELFNNYEIILLEDRIISTINPFQLEIQENEELFILVVKWE